MKKLLAVFGVLLGLGLVGGAGYFGFQSSRPTLPVIPAAPPTIPVARGDVLQTVTAPGQLTSMHEVLLSSGAGTVKQVRTRPGDVVKRGQVLVELDDSDLQLAAAAAQAAFNQAQATYNHGIEGPAPADLAAAQANVDSAQAAYDAAVKRAGLNDDQFVAARTQFDKAAIALRKAQSDYDKAVSDRAADLSVQSVALQNAKVDYDSAQANYNLAAGGINDTGVRSAAAALATAKAALLRLQSGASPAERQAGDAQLAQARIALQQAQARLRGAQVVAPFDGLVLEVKVAQGDATGGAGIVRLTDPTDVEVRATVVEEDFPLVKVGQAVELFFDALPGEAVTGHVARIVPLRDAGANPIYPIFITLDNPPAGIAPGMTADASLTIAKSTNVVRIPRSLARARADGTALVKVWDGIQSVDRNVTVGLRGNQYVEITAGLRESEQVVSR